MGQVDGDVVVRDATLTAQLRPDRCRVAPDSLEDVFHLEDMTFTLDGQSRLDVRKIISLSGP